MATILGFHHREQDGALPFAGVPPTPAAHFGLTLHAAIAVVWEQVARACEGAGPALEEFPFLRPYVARLATDAPAEADLAAWWRDAPRRWERGAGDHLPIRALRDGAGLDDAAIALLLAVGLPDEDPSFGALFEVAQARPGVRRPTAGLLHAWWRHAFGEGAGRGATRRLAELGLIRAVDAGGDVAWEVPAAVWDALRGEPAAMPFPGARLAGDAGAPEIGELILPSGAAGQLERACALLAAGELDTIVARGPRRNGRETALRAIARRLGRASLVVDGGPAGDALDGHALGPLATMLNAFPIIRYDLAAGERVTLPALPGYRGPLGVVIGPQGGLEGDRAGRLSTVDLGLPDLATRAAHLAAVAGSAAIDVDDAARTLRLTSGNLRRVAALAPTLARLEGRSTVTRADLRRASSTLNRQSLDTLATWLPPTGGLDQLAVRPDTRAELDHLLRRCRHRDDLHAALGPVFATQRSHGIRALFAGPSGTGKTFAARLIAAELGIDLYRVDLSAVVDKYIGETEKNLDRLFGHAEELDVMLLFDEGDALLGERSAVSSATDRYANLETNYLLQRLETFDGIVIVTTNASDRIDRAFERRMDVVVTFQPPEARERAAIWRSHLPDGGRVPEPVRDAIAHLYPLTGGHIRNAALHAGLLALDEGGPVTVAHVEAAIQREYRKLGKVAPTIDPRDLPEGMADG